MGSRYDASSAVFEDEQPLREGHRPDDLPERQEELEELHMALRPAARGVGANNAFLYGKAGQGKTAAAKRELAELEEHAENESTHLDLTTVYISCQSHDLSTTFRSASRIYMELTGNDRPTGHSTDTVMDMMFDAMNDIGGTIIIVLDEIDTLGSDDRLLYSLPRARSQGYVGEHVYPSIIGISNDLQWRDNLSPKVKSSLYDDQILFSPYNADEIQQILRRRAAKAFQHTELIPLGDVADPEAAAENPDWKIVEIDNTGDEYVFKSDVLTTGAIPLIAALCAEDTGDARQAIKYLRKAGEFADVSDDAIITEETVRKARSQVEKETVSEAMREMTTQAQLALAALTILEKTGDTPARTKPVYGVYTGIADELGSNKLVQRRIREHLLDLDMQGIITARKKAGGSRGGPAWHFSLQVSSDIVIDVLNSIPRLDGIEFDQIGTASTPNLSDFD
ncbi:Cdc6/Cdc18 family protein [Halovenus sp. HT40]|uniref:Cdc6/Cdc18 family protein n=1 Tax=Halovenus sp. HT40 TaxID=3126691 RepID=UPI00300EB26F